MTCDYCQSDIPQDCKAIPAVIIFDEKGSPLLIIHADCIGFIRGALTLAERMVMH